MAGRGPGHSRYVEEIGRSFRDLPWRERQTVLDDVATHLGDAGLEPADLDAWTARFGPADEYARQLRADLGMGTDERAMHAAQLVHARTGRPRTKLLIATGAVLAAAAVGFGVWIGTTQPLGTGTDTIARYGATSISAGAETRHTWQWRRGGRFAIGTWLTNDGPLDVRVDALKLDRTSIVPWDDWRVTIAAVNGAGPNLGERPPTPFTLASGDRRLIWLRGEFLRCPRDHQAGGATYVGTLDVEFALLGVARRTTLDLPFTYGVELDRPCR
jgi:hypothetical protein